MKNIGQTAIRTERALTAAHTGAGLLAPCAPKAATNGTPMGNDPRVSFVAVTAYVADQESHPPRGGFPA